MDPVRYQRLKELVGQALELPEFERDAYLQQHCSDPELLTEARDLLLHYRPETESTGHGPGLPSNIPDLTNQSIGPYQIIKLLGEGGMGVVYLAGQSAPLRRKVAIKVIKVGMDTREVISRFESERQALALMDHSNIAKVYDAGATDEGRPFFVMEYIPGVPLTKYCDDHQLGMRARLNLFIDVCRGVQHAHLKGIIHRDLKPGNILVTEVEGRPVSKIIDFGVAKATSQHLAARTLFTQMGQVIGTPEYMSPEQAGSSMDDVDMRSDVYSLGVLLYELLTGTLPLERSDIMRAGLERMAFHVQNEVPKKPSTQIATRLKTQPVSTKEYGKNTRVWAKKVRGDLDWITMKALEKERDRRYWSPASLAEDVERHLNNLPVEAGPPSGLYKIRKFVQRNRPAVAVATMALVALIGFAGWQTMQSRVIAHERDKAMANERLSLARGKIDKDPTVAVAYALASLEVLDQPAARETARQAIARAPIRHELPRWGQGGNAISIDASPDGRYCVIPWTQSEHPTVGLYSLEDYSMQVFEAPSSGVGWRATFNSDGSHIVCTGTDGINIWRVADGEHLWHLPAFTEYQSSFISRLVNPRTVAVAANVPGESTLWFELDVQKGSFREMGRSRGVQPDRADHSPAINSATGLILDYDGTQIYLQSIQDLDTDRAILVGHHEAPITSVVFDATGEMAASVDVGGKIKVWNLISSPPQLIREFEEAPGTWLLKFDPFGKRFISSWGSRTIHVYDLAQTPMRRSLPLLERTFWAHDGVFLPDRSIVTTGNGTPLVHWKSPFPVAWSLDLSETPGSLPYSSHSSDGKVLYLWTTDGEVIGVPLVDGLSDGVGSLGRTRGWKKGLWYSFITNTQRNHCLTYCYYSGTQVLDFENGKVQDLPGIGENLIPMIFSKSGRYAGFKDLGERNNFYVFDLDSMKIVSVVPMGSQDYWGFYLDEGTKLSVVGEDHIARFDLSNPTAQPDTLWLGDASGKGAILDEGRSALVRDGGMRLFWVDLVDGSEVELGSTPKERLISVDYHPGLGLLSVSGWWNTTEVFDLKNGKKWSLPSPEGEQRMRVTSWIDPLGRWLISVYPNQIIAWTLPLDPLFGEMEYDDLLESLRSLTNVRMVPDESAANGFRISNSLEMEQ